MQINKLIIRGLYGYINKTIDFNDDLTILVGINGSGKTSVLNIVNWILSPSIHHLCVTEFKQIQCYLNFKSIDYEIICKHTKDKFTYEIKTENKVFHPLSVNIKMPASEIGNDDNMKLKLIENYSRLGPDPDEKITWELISTFPNPTVIGLDRTLYIEESDKTFIEDNLAERLKRNSTRTLAPLDRVKKIVNTEYRKGKNSILNLTNQLKNNLMLSTFAGSITVESFTSGIKHKLNLNQINEVETRVNYYFQNFEKNTLKVEDKNTISEYFSQLKQITQQYQNNPKDEITKLLYGLNASQFIKVNKLLKEFEKFETESNKTLERINRYIRILNSFFKDSSKALVFKEDTAELAYHTINKKGVVSSDFKDIRFLSSGEQQILILFSYIAFNSEDGKVFIIDEPELSLHIKWQEDFLNQLDSITPIGTQLILATHSPILANKKRNKTKILLPYNN